MKKSLTLALALALVALGSVSWAATHPDSSRGPQKGQPTPEPDSLNLNSSRSNIYRHGKVTKLNAEDKTFAVQVNFSAAKMKEDFSRLSFKVGDVINITFTETTPGGSLESSERKAREGRNPATLEATTVYGSQPVRVGKAMKDSVLPKKRGEASEGDNPQQVITGRVTQLNATNQTFTVEVIFSAEELKPLPKVGKIYDITYTQTTPGGTPKARRMTQSDVIN